MRMPQILLSIYFIATGIFLYSKESSTELYVLKYQEALNLFGIGKMSNGVYQNMYIFNSMSFIMTGMLILISYTTGAKILISIGTLQLILTIDNPVVARDFSKLVYCQMHLLMMITVLFSSYDSYNSKKYKIGKKEKLD